MTVWSLTIRGSLTMLRCAQVPCVRISVGRHDRPTFLLSGIGDGRQVKPCIGRELVPVDVIRLFLTHKRLV